MGRISAKQMDERRFQNKLKRMEGKKMETHHHRLPSILVIGEMERNG